MTPTQRSLAKLKDDGYLPQVVERWNAFAKIRQDLYGCIDIIAIGNGETLAIQVTSKSNMKARINKISDNPALPEMIRSNWRVIVHGWAKNKSNRYELKEFEF